MTINAQREGRRIATTVSEETLRGWVDLPWPSADVSIDPLYLRFAARELLELREKVKQSEELEERRKYHAEHIVKPILEDYSKAIEALDAHDSLSIVPFIEELKARADCIEASASAARAERITEQANTLLHSLVGKGFVHVDLFEEKPRDIAGICYGVALSMEAERSKALRGEGGGSDV